MRKVKPVLAWASVDADGNIVHLSFYREQLLFGVRAIRVKIVPVPPKKRK